MPRIGQHLLFARKFDLPKNMDKQNHSALLRGDPPFGGKPVLDKTAFMNNICSCLDSCSAYIQALNSLCAAGTVLAHSLLQVFQELPPYRDLAEQFVQTWEEMSKATAGASSGVKTETLMALQEVLNRLEEENATTNGSVHNKSVMDNIKAVGSCLLSYVELQAQFSLSCWKSLSQISKNSESLIFFCLPREFQDNAGGFDSSNASALIRAPNDLVVSIRKYFGQVLQNTMPNSVASNQTPPMYSNYCENNESLISKQQTSARVASPNPVLFRGQQGLPPPSNPWVHHSLHSSISAPSSYGKIPQKTRASSTSGEVSSNKDGNLVSNELEEVLNLLSCQPNEPLTDKNSFLNNVLNSTANSPLISGSLSLQSVPWCMDNPKDISTVSDSAIHTGFPYQRVSSYEGKRTWPRVGSGGGDHSPFPLGGWAWGHPERSLGNSVQSSSLTSNQDACSNIVANQSSQKGNMVNWCTNVGGSDGANGWNTGQADNSSSDDGSNSNSGQDNNEVFYPLGSLGFSELVIPPNSLANRQRRHSSNDGLPDGCNNLPLMETQVEKRLNTPIPWQDGMKTVKTSTWPLKQNVNSRLGLDGLLLGNIATSSPTPPLPLTQPPAVSERPKMLDRSDLSENNEGVLRVASLVERWGGGMCTQSDKNKDEKKYTLFGQLS